MELEIKSTRINVSMSINMNQMIKFDSVAT